MIWAHFFFLANAITAFQTVYNNAAHGIKHSHDVSKHPSFLNPSQHFFGKAVVRLKTLLFYT